MRRERSFFADSPHERYRGLGWALLPLWIALAWYFLPVLQGDFVADDYVFIATGRMVDAPLSAFWTSHFYEPYYFRPLGVLSWWLATALFSLDYPSHSLINLLLHAANTALLVALLRSLELRRSAVIAAAVAFALGPLALATILWPSNRFDLLACAFLLLQAIATLQALRGSASALLGAFLAALAACWSKELAYPVATSMATLVLFVRWVYWPRRLLLFVVLGAAIAGAFALRHMMLSAGYAIASADPLGQVVEGAHAMLFALPKLGASIVGAEPAQWCAILLGIAVLLMLPGTHRDGQAFGGLIAAAVLVLLVAVVVQTPLAKPFSSMLDGGSFGTVTFARFYYAPWLALCVLIGLLVARARWGVVAMALVVGAGGLSVAMARPLPAAFADWTRGEVRPLSVLATRAAETVAPASTTDPCVVVLLGTEAKHPYFRMFSDVTVKARTREPDRVWRCHVMTERTPWLFAFPDGLPVPELPLQTIINPDGSVKADSAWGGIRYRYRLPAKDLAGLPGARFLDWRDGEFNDVTDDVKSGRRRVESRAW